jgi:exo-beta-1,3-glucanase (GH17 family)
MPPDSPSNATPSTVNAPTWYTALLPFAIGLAIVLGWWGHQGRAIALVEPTATTLPCVSYAPFRRPGTTPFRPDGAVTAAQIEQDLRLLHPITRCVRTYGTAGGLDAVPEVARKLGMRVRLGAWIGANPADNAAELRRAFALTHSHRDVIDLLVVGNEVLLRRDLPPDALAQLLKQARTQSAVPITYADVWEFWQRHAQLKAHVDTVTIHILPYWEDEPVAATHAVEHVYKIAADMRQQFAPIPVWIGETGWPSAGRQRAGAVPGQVPQAQFIRELMLRSEREPFDFNVIEAFDQPWKRALEGAMGGHWGLFTATGEPRVTLRGAVTEDAAWSRGFVAAAGGALVGLLLGGALVVVTRAARPKWWSIVKATALLTLAGGFFASAARVHWDTMWLWNRDANEWTWAGWIAGLVGLCAIVHTGIAAHAVAHPTRPALPAKPYKLGLYAVCALTVSMLFVAAASALVLLFDARYRGFYWALWIIPAASIWASRIAIINHPWQFEMRLLASALFACALALVIMEGWDNLQALGLAAIWGAMAWPFIASGWTQFRSRAARATYTSVVSGG